jgi:opacity protein-like surface antigen
MKKVAKYFFVFTLAIFLAVCPWKSASAQVGGYMGIWGGYAINPVASSGTHYYNWDHYSNFDLNIQETWVFGAKIGYIPPQLKYLAFEFEYSYLKPDINSSVIDWYGYDFVAVAGDVKLNNFMFNAVVKYPEGRFHPYVGIGLGLSYTDMSTIVTQRIGSEMSSGPEEKDCTSFAWQLLAGVEIDVTNNLSVDIGYRYFGTEIELEYASGIEFKHDAKMDFTTSMINLGLKVLF